MLLYLLGPGGWAHPLVSGLAEVLDDTPSCPDHSPLRDRVLYDRVLDTCGLHYCGPFAPSCANGCTLPHPELPRDFARADVVFFWLPEVTPFLACALALASAHAKNVWASAPRPLPDYLDPLPDDLVYRLDPDAALRDLVNRHYPAFCHTMPYEEYLKTSAWRSARAGAISRAGGRCQLCNREDPLQVHHRTYANRGMELPEDLVALCSRCHGTFHLAVPFTAPSMKGPDLRAWKLSSVTRYHSSPRWGRASDESAYRRHDAVWDDRLMLDEV